MRPDFAGQMHARYAALWSHETRVVGVHHPRPAELVEKIPKPLALVWYPCDVWGICKKSQKKNTRCSQRRPVALHNALHTPITTRMGFGPFNITSYFGRGRTCNQRRTPRSPCCMPCNMQRRNGAPTSPPYPMSWVTGVQRKCPTSSHLAEYAPAAAKLAKADRWAAQITGVQQIRRAAHHSPRQP